ncbi:MAG: hypothetical protein V7603_5220, partial [Micromonosporaceae bacterium]
MPSSVCRVQDTCCSFAGEAGTGKTRLLAEVCDRAAAEEHLPEARRLGEQMSERQRLSPGATGP